MDTTGATFEEFIRSHDKPVLADFWANWCGPCRMMGPVLHDLAREWKGRLTIVKVDTEAKPHLAHLYNISSIPTMILFKNGREIHRISGAIPLNQLKGVLSEFVV
jgi:thioredoxin 1